MSLRLSFMLSKNIFLSAFTGFCTRFDYPQGNRASRQYLQDVVLFLFDMDMLRKETPLNPDVIYQALERHRWTYAENLLERMKRVAELLDKLNGKDIYLGIHRRMIYDAGELLSLSWYEHLKHLDQLYEAHLEWQEKEDQYKTFQRFIAECIEKIDRKRLHLRELTDTYENIKSLWIEIQEFLEEKEGYPADEELGFPMLSEICKGLKVILDACNEDVEEPTDEFSFEEAWNILVRNLEQDDIDYFSEFDVDIHNLDIKKINSEFAAKVFRRAALKMHPDHGGSNEGFRLVKTAYEKVKKELNKNG